MTAPGFPGRRPPGPAGWVVVGAGWLLLVLAVVFLLSRRDGSPLPGILGGVGALCVVVGGFLLSARKAFWLIPLGLLTVFLSGVGLATASSGMRLEAQGQSVNCDVTAVRTETFSRTTTDGQGRRRSRVDTRFWHTVKCPTGTFSVAASSPRPEGTQVEMVQVPGEKPVFAGGDGPIVSLVMASIGGLLALVVPYLGWRRGRRWAQGPAHLRGAVMQPYPVAPSPEGWQASPASGPYPPPGAYPPGAAPGGSPPGPSAPPYNQW